MQRNLNLILMAVALLATLGITIALQQSARTPRTTQAVPVANAAYEQAGQPTPAASLTLLDGRTVMLADYTGKVVVLNFWATWCIPCAVEYPQMIRLAQSLPDDLVIIAVSVDAEAPAIDRFIQRHGNPPANFIIAHDPEKKVSQDIFGTVQLPESYLIDSRHILRDKIIGASVTWDDSSMLDKLNALRDTRESVEN